MATVSNAIESLRLNTTPYWWLYSGSNKVGEFKKSDDMNESIEHFQTVVNLLPDGRYSLKASENPNDHRGANHFSFSKSGNTQTSQSTAMQPVQSNNPYGISDLVYKQIQDEARQRFMFEQMYGEFSAFMKDWPELKKKIERIEKIEAYLKDEDGDGMPDIFDMAKKGTELVQSAGKVKQMFEGASTF